MAIDATNGKVVGKVPIGEGCDGVGFDKDNNWVFTSNGEGTVTVIKEKSANEFRVKQTITTKRGARTITIDPNRHTLFLPTADFEPPGANAPKGTRSKMIAGSFQVLVIQ